MCAPISVSVIFPKSKLCSHEIGLIQIYNRAFSRDHLHHTRDERFWFKAPGEIPEQMNTVEINNFGPQLFQPLFELTEGEGEEGGEEEKKK